MLRDAVAVLVAFGVGALGWLAVGVFRFSNEWVLVAAMLGRTSSSEPA